MPVRSLSSSVLTWPDRPTVERAVRAWALAEHVRRPELRRLGFFGSYARNDWGPGSDLDLVVVVADAREPFERRGLGWDCTPLPVPAELLVYTESEWRSLQASGGLFSKRLARETVWVLDEA
jgi:uncharacterized protein